MPKYTDINCIIFDMDGVVTSEEAYTRAAGATYFEILNSAKFLQILNLKLGQNGKKYQTFLQLSHKNFSPDLALAVKKRGLVTNWDLAAYLIFLEILTLTENLNVRERNIAKAIIEDYAHKQNKNETNAIVRERVSDFFRTLGKLFTKVKISDNYFSVENICKRVISKEYHTEKNNDKFACYFFIEKELRKLLNINSNSPTILTRSGEIWLFLQDIFQNWYLGSENYRRQYSQEPHRADIARGTSCDEELLVPASQFRHLLQKLSSHGIKLSIATGRRRQELEPILRKHKILNCFTPKRIVTHDEILTAQNEKFPNLSKPSPFALLKALKPESTNEELFEIMTNEEQCVAEACKVLMVGDSPGDILAAKAIGARALAVLSGVYGAQSKDILLECGADFIGDDVFELTKILEF